MSVEKINGTPIGWVSYRLGDICDFVYGEGLPAGKRSAEGNIPVYGSNGIVGFHDKAITDGPTIVIGRKGSIGSLPDKKSG